MNSAGFSLLELLIVIAISAILSTVGISSWQDLQDRSQLSAVTLGVIQFLHEVKQDANLYNDTLSIYFVTDSDHKWCLAATKDEIKPVDCQTRLRFIPEYKQIEVAGLTANSVLFFYGRQSSAKAATIRLKNRIGESRIMISVPGRMRYCSYRTYLAEFPKC